MQNRRQYSPVATENSKLTCIRRAARQACNRPPCRLADAPAGLRQEPGHADFTPLDWLALAVFVASWAAYSWLVDYSPWRDRTLTAVMDRQRQRWMEMLAKREIRIVDTAIIGGLQNGTAFFASTSLLAIGAAFAFLTQSDQVLTAVGALPFPFTASRAAWEVKAMGLLFIYAYAFFKFGWSYRLFNYTSILIGAIPFAAEHRERCGPPRGGASRAHGRSRRPPFYAGSAGVLLLGRIFGWFASAWLFLIITIVVVTALCRRQFAFPRLEMFD